MKNPPAPPPSNNTAWEAASHQAGSFTSASTLYSEMQTNSNIAVDLKKKKHSIWRSKLKQDFFKNQEIETIGRTEEKFQKSSVSLQTYKDTTLMK